MRHHNGPGLRVLSTARWYGPGYCGICGTRDETLLIPQAVRWWDPDDGWKSGVLCTYCGEDARERGPQPGDYAYRRRDPMRVDIAYSMGDEDGAFSDTEP